MQSARKISSTIDIPEIPGAYYVLVVGETGAGKSTLVNTLVNYFRGGSLSCIKVAVPTKFLQSTEPEAEQSTERSIHDNTASNTVGSVPYVLKKLTNSRDLHKKTFVIVDTPGLADTNGVDQDDINIGTILDAANRCPSLSAIILVANGTVARFGNNVKVTLSRLNGNIPDIALKNIVYVMTNSATKARSNFNVEGAPFAPKYVCYMNNSAFSSDPKEWNAYNMRFLVDDWRASMYVVQELMKGIMEMGHIATDQFAQMKKQRDLVKFTLHEARCKVEELQVVQNDILDIEAKMRRAKDDQSRFSDYTRQKKEKRVEWQDTPYHNTLCSTCTTVCHEQCGLDEVKVAGDMRFLGCAAFSGAPHCTKCGGETRCTHAVHYHACKLPRIVEETLEEVLLDVKADYDAATEGLSQATLQMSKLTDSKKLIESYITQLSQDILASCSGIKDICKGFNFAEEMHLLIQQLEAHRTLLTDPVARATSESFINSVKGILQGLHADREALKQAQPRIVKGSYATIECDLVLERTPGSSPAASPTKARPPSSSIPLSVINAGSAGKRTGGGGEGKVWCSKCKDHHATLFDCPKTAAAVPATADFSSVSHSGVACTHHTKAASTKALTVAACLPTVDSLPAVPAPADSVPLPRPPASITAASASSSFETLSGLLGATKFASAYLPKLGDFESEEDLLVYAGGHIATNNVAGLKEELVRDCGLSGVQAQTLASALFKMSM